MVAGDTSASTNETFEIRAVDRAIFFFEIRETFEIRAINVRVDRLHMTQFTGLQSQQHKE